MIIRQRWRLAVAEKRIRQRRYIDIFYRLRILSDASNIINE